VHPQLVGFDDRAASGEPDQGTGGDTLARARLADDRDTGTRVEVESDPRDDLAAYPVGLERDPQSAHSHARLWSFVGLDPIEILPLDDIQNAHDFSPRSRPDCTCRPIVVAVSASATMTRPGMTTSHPACTM
jgi:hypothetical protein